MPDDRTDSLGRHTTYAAADDPVAVRAIGREAAIAAVRAIGREAAIADVAQRFAARARLVTLVGSGGIGKTTVARVYCHQHGHSHRVHRDAGLIFLDCASAQSVDALQGLVRNALGASASDTALGQRLARYAHLLVVLDNLEQLAAEVGGLLQDWLQQGPQVQLLVTSRVALGIAEEHVVEIEPLALPGPIELELQAPSAAVQLFVARAQQALPRFALTAETIQAVISVVNVLQGMPLAIELAAAKLRYLSLRQLVERLVQPLDLLVRSQKHDRHRSMRAVLASSVALLDENEQRGFAALAVCGSQFSVAAACAVLRCQSEQPQLLLDVLSEHSLVRLVRPQHDSGGLTHIEPADPMLQWSEVVRQYAVEIAPQLVDVAACRHAHAAYFANLVQGVVVPGRPVAPGLAAHARLDSLDDLLGAQVGELQSALAFAETDTARIDLALAIDAIWQLRARHRERVTLLTATAQRLAPASRTTFAFAALLLSLGQAHRQLGELEQAQVQWYAVVEIGAALDDDVVRALAIARLAELIEISGDTEHSRRMLQDAATMLERLQEASRDQPRLADWTAAAQLEVHYQMAHALRREGQLQAAERGFAQARALAVAMAHPEWLAKLDYENGVLALFRQQYERAHAAFTMALAGAQACAARQTEAAVHSGLAITIQAQGQLALALTHHVAAVQLFREIGHGHREGSALYYLGCAYLELADAPSAVVVLEQALRLVVEVGAQRYMALIENALALAALALQQVASSRRHWTAAATAARACPTEPAVQAVTALVGVMVRLAEAGSDGDAIDTHAVVAHARATPGDDPQFVLRMFARTPWPVTPGPMIEYDAQREAFRCTDARAAACASPDDAPWVSLQKRRPLRLLLEVLMQARRHQPGADVLFDALITAGWPGEQMGLLAAKNRLHVALSTLRRMGLRAWIRMGPQGYHLDPLVTVRLC